MVLAGAVPACLLADPPRELAVPPVRRPSILHASVEPATTRPLVELPPRFRVPVVVSDPTKPFQWQLYVDFAPSSSSADFPIQSGTVGGTPDSPDIQDVEFKLSPEELAGPCHRIELLVANEFQSPRVADSRGADLVTWFYTPSGSLAGCSDYDGGPGADGAFPPDASEAGG